MDIQKFYIIQSFAYTLIACIALILGILTGYDFKVAFFGTLILSNMFSIANTLINEIRKLKE